jgi:hypothetical protein
MVENLKITKKFTICSENNTEMECEHCEIKFAKCDCGQLKNAAKAKCNYCVWREDRENSGVLNNG